MKGELTWIKSGNDRTAGLWVSIGFRLKPRENHTLYIVGGEETSIRPVGRTLIPLYFERDDQSLSCYGGAEEILVADSSIVLTLNKNGRDSLELLKIVELILKKPGKNFEKARLAFVEMSQRHGGDCIKFTKSND